MERFADTTGHLIPEWSRAEWHPIAQDILDVCEEMPVEEPAQDGSGQISQWIEEYLSENPSTDDSNEASVTYQPLRKGEEIYIHLKNFSTVDRAQARPEIELQRAWRETPGMRGGAGQDRHNGGRRAGQPEFLEVGPNVVDGDAIAAPKCGGGLITEQPFGVGFTPGPMDLILGDLIL